MIPVLAGILAAAALFLLSMPFVLVLIERPLTAQLQSEPDTGESELARQDEIQAQARHSIPGGTVNVDESTPGWPGVDYEEDPAGMSPVLQPIHAIE